MDAEPRITRARFLGVGAAAVGAYLSSGLLAGCGGGGDGGAATTGTTAGTPAAGGASRGGALRVGVTGGAQNTLYPFAQTTVMDIAQTNNLYDKLTFIERDGKATKVVMAMAQEIEASKGGRVWTIRLRDDLLCHDGKPFTAEDVVWSFAQMLDPKSKSTAGGFFPGLKPANARAIDKLTARLTFDAPIASMPERLAMTPVHMVRKDHSDYLHPIGTGPFKLASFEPGQRTVFERFDEYWQDGKPYIDQLELYNLDEGTQRVNALLAGQVDVIAGVEPSQIATIESHNMKILDTPGTRWFPIVMKKNSPPFDDVRVRQAFRLMIDRQQVVDNVFEGRGIVGNDLFSPSDPDFASDLVREQDLEQAKSLLKQAGREDLTVKLPVADYDPQIVPTATLLAAAAKKIGVTVQLERANAATYFDDVWNKRPMFCSEWSGYPLLVQALYCIGDKAGSGETDETGPKVSKLVAEASATIDDAKRGEILHDLQQYLFDEGGYIISGFPNNTDAHSDKVGGLVSNPYGSLGLFDFRQTTIAS